jgi:hypothetical protein
MSEELARTDWAEPEVMAQWRAEVNRRAALNMADKPKCMECREPEKSAHALYLLAETDLSRSEIARQVGMARQHLDRLAYNHAISLEKRRPELAAKFTENADRLSGLMTRKIDMLMENETLLADTPLKDIAIAMGVSIDKAGGLSGMATTVIEHRAGPSLDDAMKAIAMAKEKIAKGRVIEAEEVK